MAYFFRIHSSYQFTKDGTSDEDLFEAAELDEEDPLCRIEPDTYSSVFTEACYYLEQETDIPYALLIFRGEEDEDGGFDYQIEAVIEDIAVATLFRLRFTDQEWFEWDSWSLDAYWEFKSRETAGSLRME